MKKVSSVVWQFFDRLEENNRCVAVLCKLCDTEYKYFGNTTNLRAHLMKRHPIQWEFRQSNPDSQKSLDESNVRTIHGDDESTNQSTFSPISPKLRKVTSAAKDKNVRYSLSIQNPDSRATGEGKLPRIEIQRVDLLPNDEEDHEDDEATSNLVRQLHNQGSDEEWLEEDYLEIQPKRKRGSYGRIKREVVSPPQRRSSTFLPQSQLTVKRERTINDESRKDEYSVFGEYIANKLRKFKAPRTRGNVQQLITTILWQAEYGMFDDAESVKRVLMSAMQNREETQTSESVELQTEGIPEAEREEEHNQSAESDTIELENISIVPN